MAQFNERTISDFKSKLVGGGARPNLFEVQVAFPTVVGKEDAEKEIPLMVKAAELPASNVGDIPVNFRGRILHVAGDRTFDPWTVTVINNTDWKIRKAFENWSDLMNNRTYDTAATSPLTYQRNAKVFQLGRGVGKNAGSNPKQPGGGDQIPVLASYKFYGIWPSQVSSIAVDYGSTDTIEEFQVTFQVNFWEPDYSGKWEKIEQGSVNV